MPEVLSNRTDGPRHKRAVYVGRPSKWGNPFIAGKHGTRSEVVEKYRIYILERISEDPKTYDLSELRGRDLMCWCAPLECHADVLLELANG